MSPPPCDHVAGPLHVPTADCRVPRCAWRQGWACHGRHRMARSRVQVQGGSMMSVLSGLPVVPTTFQEDGGLDLDSQRRVIDFLVDAGSHGVCILANWSEQFALTDAERDLLTDVILEHVAGAAGGRDHEPLQHTVAAARSRRAEDAGAAMVMVMPPYHGATIRVGEAGIREHYAGIAARHRHPHHGPGFADGRDTPPGRTCSPAWHARCRQRGTSSSRTMRRRTSCVSSSGSVAVA